MDRPHSPPPREPTAHLSASAAPVHLPRPIPALTWQDAGGAWLLPAAAVLEVVRCDDPELVCPTSAVQRPLRETSDGGQPAAVPGLLGTAAWRGRRLPVVALGSARWALHDANPAPTDPPGGRLRLLVAPTLDGGSGLDAIALAAIGNPAVVTVREGELAPDAGPMDAEPLTLARLRLRGESLSVPDLVALEGLLAPWACDNR